MLTIERLDSGKILFPAHMLPVDLAEISYEEGVFFTCLAGIMIDTFDPFPQSVSNQFLGVVHSMLMFKVCTLRIFEERIDIRKALCGGKRCESGR